MKDPAPIHRDTFDHAAAVLRTLGASPHPLVRVLCGQSIRLLEEITLSLANRSRERHLPEADDRLAVLRMHLRLAMHLELIEEPRGLDMLRRLGGIGRQLGGWRKHLDDGG